MKRLAALFCAALFLLGAASAHAQTTTDPNAPVPVPDGLKAQPGYRLLGKDVLKIAEKVPKVAEARAKYKGNYGGAYLKGPGRWQVSYFSKDQPPKEIAQVYIDDASGKVTEAWTGYQVAWTMARGYDGAFGRKVNSPLVWVPLALLFLFPFISFKRPWRLLHLDLLVLLAFSASVYFFNRANVDTSVPIVYPLLAYVLLRMLWVGLRSRRARDPASRGEGLHLNVPPTWLAIALIFLVGFRIGLNVTNSNVIDVGYAGVIGAAKVTHGQPLYGGWPKDNEHGDTYGPVNYEAYVPAYKLFGWTGKWDDLPAAHAAAIFFDLLCLLLCFLLGRRVRGPGMGIAVAYAWAAFPFSIYALSSNSNDSLVAAGVLGALYVATSPAARGAVGAIGGLTKFATLALMPVLMTYRDPDDPRPRSRAREIGLFLAGAVVATALVCIPLLTGHDSLHTAWERTISYQSDRGSPFSVWGLYSLTGLQHVWEALSVLLAVALAFVPRRRDLLGLAALCAAIVVAVQIGVSHWFYLYIVWFFPVVVLALLGRWAEPGSVAPVSPAREPEAARSPTPAAA